MRGYLAVGRALCEKFCPRELAHCRFSSMARENQARIKKTLATLPDKAILELGDDDIRDYTVFRVSHDILVDLMISACGVA